MSIRGGLTTTPPQVNFGTFDYYVNSLHGSETCSEFSKGDKMDYNISNQEILFSKMRMEYFKLLDDYPFLTSYEIASHVLNDVTLYAKCSVQVEYGAKKLFQFWLRGNM